MIESINLLINKKNQYHINLFNKFGFINVDFEGQNGLTISNFFNCLMKSILLGLELPNRVFKTYKIDILFDKKYYYELEVEDSNILYEKLCRRNSDLVLIETNRQYNLYIITKDGFDRGFDIDEVNIENPNIPSIFPKFRKYLSHINCLYKDKIVTWRDLTEKQFANMNHLLKTYFSEVKKIIVKNDKLQVMLDIFDNIMDSNRMGSGFNCLVNFLPSLLTSEKNDILIPNINCSDIHSLHPNLVLSISHFLSKFRIQTFLDTPISGCYKISIL